ncbi:MAG: hypothetical protein ACKE51_05525 [Methylococcaceae bacterium]
MAIKKYLPSLLSSTIIVLSSDIAIAAEKTSSGPSIAGWPLLLLLAVVVIFRKKLFAEATPQPSESDHQETAVQEAAPPEIAKEPVKAPAKKTAIKTVNKPKAEKKATSIDLKDDKNQCQASTAKGTRCKRTTSLENATVSIDNKTYQLTVCKQHNNKSLKPFSELLK